MTELRLGLIFCTVLILLNYCFHLLKVTRNFIYVHVHVIMYTQIICKIFTDSRDYEANISLRDHFFPLSITSTQVDTTEFVIFSSYASSEFRVLDLLCFISTQRLHVFCVIYPLLCDNVFRKDLLIQKLIV